MVREAKVGGPYLMIFGNFRIFSGHFLSFGQIAFSKIDLSVCSRHIPFSLPIFFARESRVLRNNENICNKTWSSVSNSSLSKTFALCQFRKLKFQKLCFLPPNVILGLKK